MRGQAARIVAALATLAAATAFSQTTSQTPITLAVDLNDAPRKIVHATETIPVQSGDLTLVYPKWIPGEHMPSGPIDNMAGFVITGNGQRIKWERDKLEMFAFHLTVPSGVTSLDIRMDFLATAAAGFSAGASTSASLALLSWNELVVYPANTNAADVMITPSITVPRGWKFGTALDPISTTDSITTAFKTVSLETLVDSPVLAGRYFREVPLAPEITPKHFLDMAGDGPEDVALSDEHIAQFSRLVRETGALYKSRHYGSYHFLVTLSDQVSHFGLEHHESSDDRVRENTFTDNQEFVLDGLLLPHEFTHSWNGKYRRPAGLATPNYQEPMKGDLLWVYEGLTNYLGDVLAARCGIWSASTFRDRLATIEADYNDARPGRTWRDLQDTATMAQVLYTTGGAYDNWRRGTDFYDEGELLWLDVDTTIREKTGGKKSINDFVAAFHGLNGNTPPRVVPYTFEDVVAGLNAVVPNDWSTFLHTRLDSNQPGAPLGGLTNGGYKLTYTDTPSAWSTLAESHVGPSFWYSLGMELNTKGEVQDVEVGGIADHSAIGPGMKVIAVNGRAYTPALLRAAIRESKGEGKPAIELIVENTGTYRVLPIAYHDGERFPQLVRISGTPDRLDDILKPMTQ